MATEIIVDEGEEVTESDDIDYVNPYLEEYHEACMQVAHDCVAPPGYWEARREAYSSKELGGLERDWIKEQAASYTIPLIPQGHVDITELNSEQAYVLSHLIHHREETCRAARDGLERE